MKKIKKVQAWRIIPFIILTLVSMRLILPAFAATVTWYQLSCGDVRVQAGANVWFDPSITLDYTNPPPFVTGPCGSVDAYVDAYQNTAAFNSTGDNDFNYGSTTVTASSGGWYDATNFWNGTLYHLHPPTDPSKLPCTFTITTTLSGATYYIHYDDSTITTNSDATITATGTVIFNADGTCSVCRQNGSPGLPNLGSTSEDNNSVDFKLNLGSSSPKDSAGFLWLKIAVPTANPANSALLQVPWQMPNIDIVTNSSGNIAQVNTPQGLVNIAVINAYEYHLDCFYATNVTAKTAGFYGTNASPYYTCVISNPDGATANNRLWITEETGAVDRQFQYSYSSINSQWDLLKPDGQTLSTWRVPNAGDSTITNFFRRISVGGQVVNQTVKTFQYVSAIGGSLLTQQVDGYGSQTRTNTYSYYPGGANGYYLQQENFANGNWNYYVYDGFGRKTKVYSAYNNSAPPSAGEPDVVSNLCKLTEYTYFSDPSSVDPQEQSYGKSVFVPLSDGMGGWTTNEVAESEYYASDGSSGTSEFITPGSSFFEPGNVQTFESDVYAGSGFSSGWPTEIMHPDSTITTYSYPDQFTTIETDPDGTQSTNVVDSWGKPVSYTQIDVATGVILTQNKYTYTNSSGNYYDQLRRAYDVTDLAGRTTHYNYDCCTLESMVDPDEMTTAYGYDQLKRRVSSTFCYGTNDITTTNTLDAVGNILVTKRIGSDLTIITLQQSQFDILGNLIRQTNALGGVTTYTNEITNNQLRLTTTYPDGGTRIELYYRDGNLQSITGTSVHGVRYEYGSEVDVSGNPFTFTKEIKLKPDGSDSSEWVKTYLDMIGRPVKTLYADNSCSQSYYNNSGQLWKQQDPDGVWTLYEYNTTTGQREYTVNPAGSPAGIYGISDYADLAYDTFSPANHFGTTDRVSRTENLVVPAGGTMPDMVQMNTYVWTNGETDGTGTLLSSLESSTDGLNNWRLQNATPNAFLTNRTEISYSGSNRSVSGIAPDGSYIISAYSYGRMVSSTRYDSTGMQIAGTTYGYDIFGRQSTMTDARNGTTTLGFNNADLVTTNTTPGPGMGYPETTITAYNMMLQPYSVIQPDGTTASSTYLITGELGLQSGSRTYPVGYSYDYAGRMQTMTNWSGFGTLSGARVTTWNYDPYRGWLTSKAYADGSGPSYTYTAAGRLASRIWVRGITTSYAYDSTGSLTNINYSDATPAVTNSYDRLGRLSSAVVNGMTDTMTYNMANQMLTESFSGGALDGLSVTNGYDQFIRRTNLTALASGILNQTIYGYDYASRFSTVSDGTNNANYGYVANSPLVSQITFKSNSVTRMTTTKQYDYLNRQTQVSSVPSASYTSPLTCNYNYNPANQRTKNTLADGSYWIYGYDSLGQVTNACKYFADNLPVAGQQFDYTFDTIGNRTQTQAGGDAIGANLRTANFYANNLNQITNRDVPAYVDVMGASILTNAVTVNGSTAYRKEEYFRQQVPANNSAVALWTNMIVSGGLSVTGNVYVAKTPEVFKYDGDGNLTNDGRWAYIWDGENRLVVMTVNTNVGPQYQLKFGYDSKGRRIQKIVATNGVAYSTNNFLYDGWNLIAETRPDNSLIRSYVWGTDLSGTSQGAGGVGGLLEISYYGSSTTNCFPAYDGNGNIMALVNAADGTVVANYDYAAFGEPIRITGVMARNNPFRFSTKYADDESDLLYYGYRYYKPSTGTWPSRDPKGERGGLNLYGFVGNNPISRLDKLGLFSLVCDKCKQGNVRHVSVTDWGLLPTINQGNPDTVGSAMGALRGSELIGWVSDIGAVATGLTAAELAEKITEAAKSVADSGTGRGIGQDSDKMVDAIKQIQQLFAQQQGVYIDVQVSWQKCEYTTAPSWGGGLPFTSHLDWVGHNHWYIDTSAGASGPDGSGFASTDTTGILNAIASSFVAALQNTSY